MRRYGIKFRHQHPIDPYIVDFICLPAKLIVEIDGMSHDSQQDYDARRYRYLEEQGFMIQRFSNSDVAKNPTAIAVTMREQANELIKTNWKRPHPAPSGATLPQGEGALTAHLLYKY